MSEEEVVAVIEIDTGDENNESTSPAGDEKVIEVEDIKLEKINEEQMVKENDGDKSTEEEEKDEEVTEKAESFKTKLRRFLVTWNLGLFVALFIGVCLCICCINIIFVLFYVLTYVLIEDSLARVLVSSIGSIFTPICVCMTCFLCTIIFGLLTHSPYMVTEEVVETENKVYEENRPLFILKGIGHKLRLGSTFMFCSCLSMCCVFSIVAIVLFTDSPRNFDVDGPVMQAMIPIVIVLILIFCATLPVLCILMGLIMEVLGGLLVNRSKGEEEEEENFFLTILKTFPIFRTTLYSAKKSEDDDEENETDDKDDTDSKSSSPKKKKSSFRFSLPGGGSKKKEEEKEEIYQKTTETVKEYSQSELKEYWQHFQKIYPDGQLTKTEFIRENLEHRGGREEVWDNFFQIIDSDGNGYIDFQEYMIFLATLDTTKSSEEILNSTFDLVDLDGNGVLDREEIQWFVNVISKERNAKGKELYGEKFKEMDTEKYAEELFQRMDENGDGVIDRNEFLTTCLEDAEIREVLTTPLNQVQVMVQEKDAQTKGVEVLAHQVGGHGSSQMKEIKKTLVFKDDRIYKPIDKQEFDFYELVNNIQKDEEILKFLPKYYGRDFLEYGGEAVHYIVMDNLTTGFQKPCIMDAKMGVKGYSSDASTRKVIQQKFLQGLTSTGTLGFRLCGVQVYKKKMDSFFKMNKHRAGRSSVNKMEDVFVNFVNNGETIRRDVARQIVLKLREIEKFFESQKRFNFFSSSLLFIYDGAYDDEKSGGAPPEVRVAMVDFAHVDQVQGKLDVGYLYGLRCVKRLFQSIANGERSLGKNWWSPIKKEMKKEFGKF